MRGPSMNLELRTNNRRCLVVLAAAVAFVAGCRQPGAVPVLDGASMARPFAEYRLAAVATDAGGDPLSYRFDWGDSTESVWTEFYGSGEPVHRLHIYADTGRYAVRVRTRLATGVESGWSDELRVDVRTGAVPAPPKPIGPSSCSTGVAYGFSVSCDNPYRADVSVQFRWGPYESEWSEPVPYDRYYSESLAFTDPGVQSVLVRFADATGGPSAWSDSLVVTAAGEVLGGAPTGVGLRAQTDSTVEVYWTAPARGTPDRYVVSFMQTGTSSYVKLTPEPTGSPFDHDPNGMTGRYMVTAVYGSTEYNSETTPTTEPVATVATVVSELDAVGYAGFGWDRITGGGMVYSMHYWFNAATVDFYISDFASGFSGPTYSIASPDMGPYDPSNTVPAGAWRASLFTNPLASEVAPLPERDTAHYFNYTDLTLNPTLIGVYTADGYYALVKITDVNTSAGTVSATTWFQMVKGLRLIYH